jgi:hypothetical protein
VAQAEGVVVYSNYVSNVCVDVVTDSLIRFECVQDGSIRNNTVRDAIKGYGIHWRRCIDLYIAGNSIARTTYSVDSEENCGCRLQNNMIDVGAPGSIDSGTLAARNAWQAESITGSVKLELTSSDFASASIAFPDDSFSSAPIVIVTAEDTGQPLVAQYSKATKSGFTASVRVSDGSAVTHSVVLNWSAVAQG